MTAVEAYAKLNLSLAVLGRRSDGFHEIDSLVQTIDLCDRISIDLTDGGLVVENDLAGLAGRDLARVAAEAILARKRSNVGVAIHVEKGIPAGAGLGGGSSDAAAVLAILDRLVEPGLPSNDVARIAAEIGSDVPLFLRGGLLRVAGRGERVEREDASTSERFLVAVPPIHCDTATVYAQYDETADDAGVRGLRGENALLGAALMAYPELGPYHEAVLALGGEYAGMSGSGSSFYAAFKDVRATSSARERLTEALPDAKVFQCRATDAGHRVVEGRLP